MIYIPPVPEISPFGVIEPGIANRERIALRPTEEINLAHFGIMVALRGAGPHGELFPINDVFFWFGEKIVTPPCWILVFTGKGQPQMLTENGQILHAFFWGRESTLFAIPNLVLVPLVFRIGAFSGVSSIPSPGEVKKLSKGF
jgi:hypothetical protein